MQILDFLAVTPALIMAGVENNEELNDIQKDEFYQRIPQQKSLEKIGALITNLGIYHAHIYIYIGI